jgi:hypothetical protein
MLREGGPRITPMGWKEINMPVMVSNTATHSSDDNDDVDEDEDGD